MNPAQGDAVGIPSASLLALERLAAFPSPMGASASAALHQFPDDDDLPDGNTVERAAALMATARTVARQGCHLCGAHICGHDALLAILLGSRHAPRCSRCAAGELREPVAELRERALQWIRRRECFLAVWRAAGEAEGFGAADRPQCLFAGNRSGSAAPAAATATATAPPAADRVHDAGDLGCGDLVLELKFTLASMPPGSVLEVRATDPAAPIDLPAWCGLVGHRLLHSSPPRYWIERKPQP